MARVKTPREALLKARKTRMKYPEPPGNPRLPCHVCIGRKYCCRHFRIVNSDYPGYTYSPHADNFEIREKICVCGKCKDADIILDPIVGTNDACGSAERKEKFDAIKAVMTARPSRITG